MLTIYPGQLQEFAISESETREIERRFLVRELPPLLERHPRVRIVQGYIADEPNQVRLRTTDDDSFCLTVKTGKGAVQSGKGTVRGEHEIELTRAQFEKLWPLTAGRRLSKCRYRIPHGDFTIELDEFQGANRGLLVAEVEFSNEAACYDFVAPEWFGDDISSDSRYSNRRLATE
jgi:CYTH domain-containing protein